MEEIGNHFRLGIWTLNPENRARFIEAWQTSAAWLKERLPAEASAVLLEDTNDPGRFISFAPQSDPEVVSQLMAETEFQELWNRVMQFCDVKPHSMRVVSSVSG